MKQTLAFASSLAAVYAVCRASPAKLGLSFDKRADSLPTLTLPYATYQAANYNPDGDVCLPLKGPKFTSDISCRYTLSKTSASPLHQ